MSDKNLKGLRNKIDKIDQELYALIQKRASHAVAIGKIKSKVSPKSSFYKPDREAKILRNILKANNKAIDQAILSKDFVEKLLFFFTFSLICLLFINVK